MFIFLLDGGMLFVFNGCIVICGKFLLNVVMLLLFVDVLEFVGMVFFRLLRLKVLRICVGIFVKFMLYLLNDVNCYFNRGRKCVWVLDNCKFCCSKLKFKYVIYDYFIIIFDVVFVIVVEYKY